MYIDRFIRNVLTYTHTLAVPKYHRCFVESISSVTHDSKLFSLRLPAGSYLNVPIGHHLAIRADVDGKLCIRMHICGSWRIVASRCCTIAAACMGLGGLIPLPERVKARAPYKSSQSCYTISCTIPKVIHTMIASSTTFNSKLYYFYYHFHYPKWLSLSTVSIL